MKDPDDDGITVNVMERNYDFLMILGNLIIRYLFWKPVILYISNVSNGFTKRDILI